MPFATPIAATILCAQVSFRPGGASAKVSVRVNIQVLKEYCMYEKQLLIKEEEKQFSKNVTDDLPSNYIVYMHNQSC